MRKLQELTMILDQAYMNAQSHVNVDIALVQDVLDYLLEKADAVVDLTSQVEQLETRNEQLETRNEELEKAMQRIRDEVL